MKYKLDDSSGFGQFAKIMGYTTKIVSIMNMTLSDTMDLITLDSKLAIYVQYKRFLQDVISYTEKVPFQMRWAAFQILTELEDGYLGKIKDIALDILQQTNLNSVVLEEIFGETVTGSISE